MDETIRSKLSSFLLLGTLPFYNYVKIPQPRIYQNRNLGFLKEQEQI